MSNVPEYKRKKSTCEAIIKARHLATYTIQICANSKVFLPEYKSSLTDEIVHDAKEAYILAWKANSIRVTGQLAGELGTLRLQLQKEAILNCKSLLPLIELAQKVYHLGSGRIEYWARLTLETASALTNWHEGDIKRYKNMIK